MTKSTEQFTLATVEFPDGAKWTRVSPTTITYTHPEGGEKSWTWPTHVDCSAAWLAVCTH